MSGLLDERGRILGRINVVDALVLVVIIALLLFVVSRSVSCTQASSTTPVSVTLSFQGVRNDIANSLMKSWRTGTVLSNQGGVPALGTIKSITSTKSVEEDLTQDGRLKTFSSPLTSDLTVVITGDGTVSKDSVTIGGKSLMIGDTLTVQGAKASFQATVLDVSWGAGAGK